MKKLVALLLLTHHVFSQTNAPQNRVSDERGGSVSVIDFGAKGNNSTDDTGAVQACIDYSASHRASCFVPPGEYKITGSGLHILGGQPSLYGLQSMGNGSAALVYYGNDTALRIGDGTHRLFAINLINVGIVAAPGYAAKYGIDAQNLSGGEWNGVTVGGGGVSGTFSAAIRFTDAGGINMHRLIISNRNYTAGTTGILFDKRVTYGNVGITIDASDQSNVEKMFEIRDLATGYFDKVYVENSRYSVFIDNTTYDTTIQNVVFDESEFNTSGIGPKDYKVLSVTGSATKVMEIDQLRFSNSRFFLSGGVTKPFVFNIAPNPSSPPRIWFYLDNNVIIGADGAVVEANSTLVNANFGPNLVRDRTGRIRTPDFTGIGTVQDKAPQDTAGKALVEYGSDGSISYAGLVNARGGEIIGKGGSEIHKYSTVSIALNFPAPQVVPGCTSQIPLTLAGAVAGSAPIFFSPPVPVPAGMTFSAWATPAGQILAQWCQFAGPPTDPDGTGATYTVSVLE